MAKENSIWSQVTFRLSNMDYQCYIFFSNQNINMNSTIMAQYIFAMKDKTIVPHYIYRNKKLALKLITQPVKYY